MALTIPVLGSLEQEAGLREISESIKRGYPDWTPRVLTTEDLAGSMLAAIEALLQDDSGAFLSERGSRGFFE
jgi:hypothetical protein